MTRRQFALALIGAGALAGCTAQAEREPAVRAPAVEVVGPAVSCVQTSRIRNTVVHDDYTIDFVMDGGDVYRNTLPGRCPGLGFEERFAYQVSTGQLCRVDTITVLQTGAGRGPTCGLGPFVPVRYAEARD
jgi:hypothetical protein